MDYLEFLEQLKKDVKKHGQVDAAKKYETTQEAVSQILSGKRSGFRVWKKLQDRKAKS